MKVEKLMIQGLYKINGEYMPFDENPMHGTYFNVDVSISRETKSLGQSSYFVDVVNIEGFEPIECELVNHCKKPDGTVVISLCQDWG